MFFLVASVFFGRAKGGPLVFFCAFLCCVFLGKDVVLAF